MRSTGSLRGHLDPHRSRKLWRLATALVEVADDYLSKISVFNAIATNGYMLLSFLIFRNKGARAEKKE